MTYMNCPHNAIYDAGKTCYQDYRNNQEWRKGRDPGQSVDFTTLQNHTGKREDIPHKGDKGTHKANKPDYRDVILMDHRLQSLKSQVTALVLKGGPYQNGNNRLQQADGNRQLCAFSGGKILERMNGQPEKEGMLTPAELAESRSGIPAAGYSFACLTLKGPLRYKRIPPVLITSGIIGITILL